MTSQRESSDDSLRTLALYNYGHYTSMLVSGRRVRGLQLHLSRLEADSTALFDHSVNREKVLHSLRALAAEHSEDIVARVTVCAADFVMQRPADARQLELIVTTRPAPSGPASPMTLATVAFVRELPHIKHVGLFGQLWCRRTAQLAGRDDALLVSPEHVVLEGPTWNIGFIRPDGRVVWPDSAALPGVTLTLLRGRYEQQFPEKSSSERVTLADLDQFSSVFTTNAVSGIRPVSAIDGHTFQVHSPVLDELIRCYDDITPDEI